MSEAWTISDDGHSATVEGRQTKPLLSKLNPIWWVRNDDEQSLEEAPWYLPDYPQWQRRLFWELRNPLQNFRAYVVGVQDRNYTVDGRPAAALVVQRDDLEPPEQGYQYSTLKFKSGLRLGFVSYCGSSVRWYAGWQPSGFFGFKFNLI